MAIIYSFIIYYAIRTVFSTIVFRKNIISGCLINACQRFFIDTHHSEVFTVHEYKHCFPFWFLRCFVARGRARSEAAIRGRLVRFVALLAVISSSVWHTFTSNPAKDLRHRDDADRPWRNFCAPLEIFLSRACYDTGGGSSSSAFPVANGRRYSIYEKSRVFSSPHNSCRFPCVSPRHCSLTFQQVSSRILSFFLSKFPNRSNGIQHWNKVPSKIKVSHVSVNWSIRVISKISKIVKLNLTSVAKGEHVVIILFVKISSKISIE